MSSHPKRPSQSDDGQNLRRQPNKRLKATVVGNQPVPACNSPRPAHRKISQLPDEILNRVFSQIEDVVWKSGMRRVSTRWNKLLLRNDSFAASHGLNLRLDNEEYSNLSDESSCLFPGLTLSHHDFNDRLLPRLKVVKSITLHCAGKSSAPIDRFIALHCTPGPANIRLIAFAAYSDEITDDDEYSKSGVKSIRNLVTHHGHTLQSLTGTALRHNLISVLPQLHHCRNIRKLDLDFYGGSRTLRVFKRVMKELTDYLTLCKQRDQPLDLKLIAHGCVFIIDEDEFEPQSDEEEKEPEVRDLDPFIALLQSLPDSEFSSVDLTLAQSEVGVLYEESTVLVDYSWLGAVKSLHLDAYAGWTQVDAFEEMVKWLPHCQKLEFLNITEGPDLGYLFTSAFHPDPTMSETFFDWWMIDSHRDVKVEIDLFGVAFLHMNPEQPIDTLRAISMTVDIMNERHKAAGLHLELELKTEYNQRMLDPTRMRFKCSGVMTCFKEGRVTGRQLKFEI